MPGDAARAVTDLVQTAHVQGLSGSGRGCTPNGVHPGRLAQINMPWQGTASLLENQRTPIGGDDRLEVTTGTQAQD